jgi:flagellar basal-body rod protein FlgB
MILGDIPIFRMMSTKMSWLGHRQRVLAQNIANSDTPGYVPSDLKPIDFKRQSGRQAFRLQLAVTNTTHIESKIQQSGFGDEKKSRTSYETSPTGNAVVLEEQMIKAADNAAAHQLVTNLYKKNVSFIKIALGRQSGR